VTSLHQCTDGRTRKSRRRCSQVSSQALRDRQTNVQEDKPHSRATAPRKSGEFVPPRSGTDADRGPPFLPETRKSRSRASRRGSWPFNTDARTPRLRMRHSTTQAAMNVLDRVSPITMRIRRMPQGSRLNMLHACRNTVCLPFLVSGPRSEIIGSIVPSWLARAATVVKSLWGCRASGGGAREVSKLAHVG